MVKFRINCLLGFFILIFTCSCKDKQGKYSYLLLYDIENSSINPPFFRDSLLIIYFGNDSLLIRNYYNNKGDYFQNSFFYDNDDSYYEKRIVMNYPNGIFEIDTIQTFSKKDTTFLYHTNRDDFIVTLVDLSLFDSKYIITENSNGYEVIKQSLIDTTYKEVFFYDEKYCIYKFINTWQGNKCVYVKK